MNTNVASRRSGQLYLSHTRYRTSKAFQVIARTDYSSPLYSVARKLLMVVAGSLLFASQVSVAQISPTRVSIVSDGAAPFSATQVPGGDTSSSNGIVRTNDEVTYSVQYNAVSTASSSLVLTLPVGMVFESTATASTVCNGTGGGTLSSDRRVLTCNIAPVVGTQAFNVKAFVGALANGTQVRLSARSGATSTSSPDLIVSAGDAKATFVLYSQRLGRVQNNGQWGRSFEQLVRFGSNLSSGSQTLFKGQDGIAGPVQFRIKVQQGAVMLGSCSAASGGGTRTCTQPGGAGSDILVVMQDARQDFLSVDTSATGFKDLASTALTIWVPESPNFPPSTLSYLKTRTTWDQPRGLSGGLNIDPNATVHAPDYDCMETGSFLDTVPACIRIAIDRTAPTRFISLNSGAVSTSSSLIYADNNGETANDEKILPNQNFVTLSGFRNDPASPESFHMFGGCITWDPMLMEITGRAVLRTSPSTASGFLNPDSLGWAEVSSTDYIVEYSAQAYADDAARRSASCGLAGDGAAGWVSAWDAISSNAITSVRFRYRIDAPLDSEDTSVGLRPGWVMGLSIPKRRSTSALSLAKAVPDQLQAQLPWFRQSYNNVEPAVRFSTFTPATPTIARDRGGSVQAVSALVRHSLTDVPLSIAPGQVFPLTVIPRTVGAAASGFDAIAEQVQVVVDFPNTYFEPIDESIAPSLPSGATYTVRPANLGADGLPGTADDGLPARVTITLGNLMARGGSASTGHSGHVTTYAPISFQVRSSRITPNATVHAFTSLISAANDYTGAVRSSNSSTDRTEGRSITVNGVSTFEVSKSITSGGFNDTSVPGESMIRVTSGEPFTYTISFGNTTSENRGRIRFVDVLPYSGDGRGTTGVSQIQVQSVTAAMNSFAQGLMSVEYTTSSASSVLATVMTSGSEDAPSGVSWIPYSSGPFPDNVTALRFTSAQGLNAGYGGTATITLKVRSSLDRESRLVNNVYGRVNEPNGVILVNAGLVTVGGRPGASIVGRVFEDVDGDSFAEENEPGIPNVNVRIVCTASPNCVLGQSHEALTDTNGFFRFSPGALVDGASGFPGVVSGTWDVIVTPDVNWTNIGSKAGSFDGVLTGNASGRLIAGIVVTAGSVGLGFDFLERKTNGRLRVKKVLARPIGIPEPTDFGPFDFTFDVVCGPERKTSSVVLSGFPQAMQVELGELRAEDSCGVVEVGRSAPPRGYVWQESSVPDPVVIPVNGVVDVEVNGMLIPLETNLAISIDAEPDLFTSGGLARYSVFVENNGPADSNGAVVTSPPQPGIDCGIAPSTVSCSAINGAVCPNSLTAEELQTSGLVVPSIPSGASIVLNLVCVVTASGSP
ncbi:hypothetical protein [Microseira sp. BLCC-F43]|uniref:hypothetical protein n=1 Tax=Microseira sp. BLCC-F43 TaxID=3153602 RepID=UPI0035B7DF26